MRPAPPSRPNRQQRTSLQPLRQQNRDERGENEEAEVFHWDRCLHVATPRMKAPCSHSRRSNAPKVGASPKSSAKFLTERNSLLDTADGAVANGLGLSPSVFDPRIDDANRSIHATLDDYGKFVPN